MKITLIVSLFCNFATLQLLADSKRHHKAHEHGSAKLDVAIEGKTARFEFESPADSLYGFEHKPKSQADKDKVAAVNKSITDNIAKFVQFGGGLTCTAKLKDIDAFDGDHHDHHDKHKKDDHHKGEVHSDVEIEGEVTCDRDITKGSLSTGIHDLFPGVKEIKLQLIGDKVQKGQTLRSSKDIVEF